MWHIHMVGKLSKALVYLLFTTNQTSTNRVNIAFVAHHCVWHVGHWLFYILYFMYFNILKCIISLFRGVIAYITAYELSKIQSQ